MNIREAVTSCLTRYASSRGRAPRSEYWWFQLFATLTYAIAFAIDKKVGLSILPGLFGLALLLPSVAVTLRRLHDTNRAGWWYLISVVPLIGQILLIVCLCQKGTEGENDYGDALLDTHRPSKPILMDRRDDSMAFDR